MDLLTTVRKEGSRGGRGDFKWEDVQSSSSRENYLGHSLMAPVGRWQKGRDLNWYAKGNTEKNDGETDADRAARERKEEIRQVKEAEQDALARALGFEVAPRNPNMEVLGNKKEVDRVLKEEVEDEGGQGGKGLGFGSLRTRGVKPEFGDDERIEGNAEKQDAELGKALREYKRRHGDDVESGQSKSNDRERRHHRHHDRDRDRDREYGRKSRSRSRSRERRPRGGRHAKGDGGDRPRNRSRSPHRRRHEREDRYRREDYDRRR